MEQAQGCADARASITEQFLQSLARVFFALVGALAGPDPLGHVKVFAKVRHVLLVNKICAALATLFGRRFVVVNAVETNFQVRTTLRARFNAPGISRQLVFATAVVAMTSHVRKINIKSQTPNIK